MPLRPLIANVATTLVFVAALAEGAPTVKRQYRRDTSFRVLFNPPTTGSSKDQPRKIELHTSSDQGVTWSVVGTAKPSDQGIVFRATDDGEYWFMLRTKYASGLYLPKGPPQAGMKLVVDTTPPLLELDAHNDGSGEVVVRWHVADTNLKRESFKLEYKAGAPNAGWQAVAAIDPTDAPQQAGDLSGEATIVLPIREQSAPIIVRAEASDEAGNRTVKEQPLPPAQSSVASPLDRQAAANDSPPDMSPTFSDGAGHAGEEEPATPAYPRTATPDWPAEESDSPLTNSSNDRHPTTPAPRHELVRTANQAVRRLPALPLATPRDEPPREEASPPAGVNPHPINKPRFELLYDVDAIGSSGIVQVELWITSDGGHTWTNYGLDEDCQSPMLVKVEQEGLYGFRVVIETSSGLRSPTPVSGDLPDIWVDVDFTKPEATLVSAVQGDGEEADRLIVSWQADDKNLAARGISLRWSQSPQGPWGTVASGLENTGRYGWRLDQHLPPQVYLLLEAADKAGNVATDQLAEPISLERIRPQGHIREVRPLGAAPPTGNRG